MKPNLESNTGYDGGISRSKATQEFYALMEIVADRAEMHKNIGTQRDNWNRLLLSSVNVMTFTAATMAGLAAVCGVGAPALLALKLSACLLYMAATGILLVMNKLQPSQLAEEQRNASRLFKQLHDDVKITLALRNPTADDVEDVMGKVLALDKAYPLPLLGTMLDKFPAKVEPAVWWPRHLELQNERKSSDSIRTHFPPTVRLDGIRHPTVGSGRSVSPAWDPHLPGQSEQRPCPRLPTVGCPTGWPVGRSEGPEFGWNLNSKEKANGRIERNGWNGNLEEEMREVLGVLKRKDAAEYVRLCKIVLKVNKILAFCGPLFTGLAAVGSLFVGVPFCGWWAAFSGVMFGALATVVNTMEHGFQVGMVFEMYRDSAGFFRLMEETILSNLEEKEADKRENGELLELKVALQLGRSLPELRELARSRSLYTGTRQEKEEFASKLF